MHAFTVSLLLLPTVLAHRHRYGPGSGHYVHHRPLSASGVTGGSPLPSTGYSAPYGLGNTTSVFGSTGLVTGISTGIASETSDLGGIGGSSVAPTSSAVVVGHAGSPGGSSLDAYGSSSCDSDVVTVTENPIVTVTVTPSQVSTSELALSPSVSLPVPSQSSVFSIITGVTESTPTPSTHPSAIPVTKTSTPELPSVPVSTPDTTSTSAVETTVASTPKPTPTSVIEATTASPSETPSSSPSTVTVIPVPATTAADETTTPVSTSQLATFKKSVSATVVSSSSVPESSTGASTSSPGGCPGKRGIIATAGGNPQTYDQGNISLAYANEPNICWIANWYSAPPPYWNKAKEFIPQDYGKSSSEKEWATNAKQAIAKGEKIFFSFGEPEASGRDHLEPQEAVDLYMKLMQPYADNNGVKLCSPAVLQPRTDMNWLASFLDKCDAAGCTIDMICVHWFDTTSAKTPGFPEFKRTVENATALAKGKKVWVDNFQANGTPEDVKAFLDEALPYLEGNSNVERYAYVPPLRTDPSKTGSGYRTDQFIDPDLSSNGTLTALGKYYSDFKVGA